jgi:hypothetical protein
LFQAEAQLVEDGRAFAENRVDLDQLLVGGDQVADVLPWYFKVVQRTGVLKECEQAAVGLCGRCSMDAGEVPLGVEVDQQRWPFGTFYTRRYFSLNIQVSATNSATRRELRSFRRQWPPFSFYGVASCRMS